MDISRSLKTLCIKALTESMDTGTMTHVAKEFFPWYNLNERMGFPSSLCVPNVDAARQIITDISANEMLMDFILLLVKINDQGLKGRKIHIAYLREIIREIYNQGYVFDKENGIFLENPRVRKTRNWGILTKSKEYTFTFLRIDIENSSRLVKKYTKNAIHSVYADLRNMVQNAVETRNGRIWAWEGDGGLASFFYGKRDYAATLAAMEILHELFLYNRLDSPIDQTVAVRIAVHSGRCEYLVDDTELKKADPVKKIMDVEQNHTPANHVTISVAVRQMLDSILANQFKALPQHGNGYFSYTLELAQ
ncbi:MAG: hypothetical protein JXB03_01235 [Spirochaetales bacterium]|nr:hypothetical protein [Spirochaetales bacterium]